MRADLERINKMINYHRDCGPEETNVGGLQRENDILRELLTSWQALTSNEYQTDVKLHLNMLTTKALDTEWRTSESSE